MPEESYISDTGFYLDSHSIPARVFYSASSYTTGATFQISEKETATKLAEIRIDAYRINNKEHNEPLYDLSIEYKLDEWRDDHDTAALLEKIAQQLKRKRHAHNVNTSEKYQNALQSRLSELDEKLKENPSSPALLKEKGVVFFNLQRYKEARACFDKVLEINRDDEDALFFRRASLKYDSDS
ncbi:tetratricopeptide repeat protein [Nitrososphaera viennensis]|nr:tetratricopeptide repeat protein [Nitrososphaera viennensis]UVS68895.1 tetratricopeptide repeat protein [Nitrososphaera viennensis]